MAERAIFPAYLACLQLGVREALRSRSDLLARLGVYAILLTIFSTIYRMMPMEKFDAGMTAEKLLWYFAITEIVVTAGQGLRRAFGKQIAAGELTALMQRPGSMRGMALMQVFGSYSTYALLSLLMALVALPLLANAPFPVPLAQVPWLFLSLALAGYISLALGYLVSLAEIFGPYSQPVDWIVSKFIMALGGLFIPISFYPPWAEHLALLTPFPAILYVPGSFVLEIDMPIMIERLSIQAGWAIGLSLVTMLVEARLLQRVMVRGD